MEYSYNGDQSIYDKYIELGEVVSTYERLDGYINPEYKEIAEKQFIDCADLLFKAHNLNELFELEVDTVWNT